MKYGSILVVVCLLSGIVRAGDLYVEKGHASASDGNPGTEALPFRTIQGAIDAVKNGSTDYSFDAGNTIWVKPGDYDEGGWTDSNGYTNRVYFSVKCRVVATGDKNNTAIVGCVDPDSKKYGPGAVRCVRCPSAGKGSILRGFTITNGCAYTSEAWGGGVDASGAGTDFYVADCSILYNYAFRGGGMNYGTAVRCYFRWNHVWGTLYSTERGVNMIHCVVYASGYYPYSNAGLIGDGKLVNCTVLDCLCGNGSRTGIAAPIYNTIAIYGGGGANGGMGTVTDSIEPSNGIYQVVSPILQDWRLLNTASAIGRAKAEHLSLVPYPDELGNTDYLGGAVPTTGSLNCGAVQEVVTPASGRMAFKSACQADGKDSVINSYIYAETFPTQYCIKAASNGVIFDLECDNLKIGSNNGYGPYPDVNGEILLLPPPVGVDLTYSICGAAATFWVDDKDGLDTNDGSKAAPFKTLSRAASAVSSNRTIINVLPGTYDDLTSGSARFTGHSSKLISLRAVEGPEKTVIVGGDGIRCVSMSYMGSVCGFTLTGAKNAIAVSAGQPLTILSDCIVSNNTNTSGTILNNVVLQRDLVVGNTASAYIWSGIFACGTVFAHNTSSAQIASGDCKYNCTLFGNTAPSYHQSGWKFANSVFEGPGTYNKNLSSYPGSHFHDLDADSVIPSGIGTNDTRLVTNGVPLAVSPVLAGGVALTNAAFTNDNYRILGTGGPDSARITFTADGIPNAGAWQKTVAIGAIIVEDAKGGLALSGAHFGENLIGAGETLTFTVTRTHTGTRWCAGLDVNGAYVDFDDYPDGWTCTVSSGATSVKVKPVYSTVLYCAPEPTGSDANDGFTREAPKTLQGALDLAVSGETVIALKGTYSTGKAKVAAADAIWSRAVVSNGVALVSDEGAEKTILLGEASDATVTKSGCGTNAVRCARLVGAVRLRGFTLTGGHTCICNGKVADQSGGAVYAAGTTAVVEDCIVSNNVSYCAAVYACTSVRCLFYWNHCWSSSACLRYSKALNCLFDHNRGDNVSGYSYLLMNCTFGTDNRTFDGKGYTSALWHTENKHISVNCLFFGAGGTSNNGSLYNCAFDSAGTGFPDPATYARPHANLIVTNAAAIAVDANYVPTGAASVLVDAGTNDLYAANFTDVTDKSVDFGGVQRIYNGRIDIGCREFDWRPTYARNLGARVAVSAATTNATATAGRGLRLIDGQSATLGWKASSSEPIVRTFPFTVANGTLTVTVNGAVAAAFTADGEWRYEGGLKSDTIVFSFEGDGSAVLARSIGPGLMLIVK